MKKLNVIGIMSGTSLDGLDIVAAEFSHNNKWEFKIIHGQTFEYESELKEELQNLDSVTALQYEKINHNLGRNFGEKINEFLCNLDFEPDFIASHGHTIFHQPEIKLTTQIGHPAAIQAVTGIPVVADFRTTDVHLGGQGAPLVPIGDLLLFPEFTYCLNLGGIANLSIQNGQKIKAFDICAANMALNYLANKKDLEYDEDGQLASAGTLIPELLDQFVNLNFHSLEPPKSLGKEWFNLMFKPLLNKYLKTETVTDVLNTICEGIAMLISHHITSKDSLMITGGGALNTYLKNRISYHCKTDIALVSKELINYKEALIFGFLGVLRWIKEPNILSTVTGVERNHIGGCIYA